MRGLNKAQLIGNVGRDPEIQYLEENLGVVKVALATTEIYRDKTGQTLTETQWHTVILWRSLAELAGKYLKKGSLVYVEGKLKNRQYEDKDHITRYVTEIIADEIILLDKKQD